MPYYRLSLVLAVITCSALAHSQATVAATPDCAYRSTTTDGTMLAQAGTAAKTDAAISAATATTAPGSSAIAPESTDTDAKATPASESVPITTREQALEKAKLGAGRDNPFSPI